MDHFTPLPALIGGCMIGIAASIYLSTTGRYAGLSGMLRSVAFPGDPDRRLDALFLLGLFTGGLLWMLPGSVLHHKISAPPLALVMTGGILVGFGTALGNGCTSGHGVCGLGRLSLRSLVAVVTFLTTGIITVYVVRHVMGLPS